MTRQELEDLIVEFDEYGFYPSILCNNPHQVIDKFHNKLKELLNDIETLNILKEKLTIEPCHEIWDEDVYFLKIHPIDWNGFSEDLCMVDLDSYEHTILTNHFNKK